MSWIGSAISGGSNLLNVFESVGTGVFADIQAKKARKFQQKVLKNQIRWRMQDMQRAGLNPILALGTPGGAPGGVVADTPSPSRVGTGLVSTALEIATAKENLQNLERAREVMDSQISANEASSYRDRMAGDLQMVNTKWEQEYGGAMRQAGIDLDKANSEQAANQAAVTKLGMPAAQAMADFYTENPWAKPLGEVLGIGEGAASAAKKVQDVFRRGKK